MNVTIEGVKKKLGFDPLTFEPEYYGHEDDSIPNPYKVLNKEEEAFLDRYFEENREKH